MNLNWILALVCLASALGAVWTLSCKDDNGADVDWWYLYKLPRNATQSDPNVVTGYAYTYILSSGDSSSWTLSPKSMSDPTSMVGQSLSAMYTSSKLDYTYALYNDHHPDGSVTSSRGHTKGVLLADQTQGLWIIHSSPRFPPATSDPYSYPSSGTIYGQSYLCITFNTTETVDIIGLQFQYNIPFIYDSNMPSWSQSVAPKLYDYIVNDVKVTLFPWHNVASFNSSGGQVFRSFAKHNNFGLDLYYDLVASDIQSDLTVETWNHGSDDYLSQCVGYDVINVQKVSNSAVGYSFITGNDHSKWGAAPSGSATPWICVGDINRAASQSKRAGGTVCSINRRPWEAFSGSVVETEACLLDVSV